MTARSTAPVVRADEIRIARYANFDDMFAHETVASVNPLATKQEQLANSRQIYPPEREALGVVAIGIGASRALRRAVGITR